MTLFQSPADRQTFSEACYKRAETLPGLSRSDTVIEEEIWQLILKDRSLGPRYQENLAVEVEGGRVRLRGHVLKPWHGPLLVQIANHVEGVALVKNELVADDTLRDMVIQALVEDATTSPYIFTVKCHFGWVRLSGLVPAQEIAKAAEGVVGLVPAVRGVLALPAVFGATWLAPAELEPARRTLQPRLAAAVYQDDAPASGGGAAKPARVGLVSQVMIDPCSRLVSAIGVRSRPSMEDQQPVERLVPVDAVEAVNERGVWLKEGETIDRHPPYDRRQFPAPPASWRPPFPYLPGSVRWSFSL